jgi:hypothetical protein
MKPFPWRIGPARSHPSLRDSCGVSPRDDDSTDTFFYREPFPAGGYLLSGRGEEAMQTARIYLNHQR